MNKRRKNTFGIFILLAIFIYLSYIFMNQQRLLYAKNIELSKIEDKIAEEGKLNEVLKMEKEMIQSDEYIEKVAREQA